MNFNDLLKKHDIDPDGVLVMRHRPKDRELNRVFPWLITAKPEVFNAYQQTQGSTQEKQLSKASHLAAFYGNEPQRATLIGIYKVAGYESLPMSRIAAKPEIKALWKHMPRDTAESRLWFDLQPTTVMSDWQGKLIVQWPGKEIVWSRWASQNELNVISILDTSVFAGKNSDWRELDLSWNDLQIMPQKLNEMLRSWRGIYYIWDETDRSGYVGSATGTDGFLGRWLNYRDSGDGGNKLLCTRSPENLRFTILEWASPEMSSREILEREKSWKIRLHTRSPGGLNGN